MIYPQAKRLSLLSAILYVLLACRVFIIENGETVIDWDMSDKNAHPLSVLNLALAVLTGFVIDSLSPTIRARLRKTKSLQP